MREPGRAYFSVEARLPSPAKDAPVLIGSQENAVAIVISERQVRESHICVAAHVENRVYVAIRSYAGTGDAVVAIGGDEEPARCWLTGPKVALGGATPLEYARTPEGSDYVIQLLGPMAHGAIS